VAFHTCDFFAFIIIVNALARDKQYQLDIFRYFSHLFVSLAFDSICRRDCHVSEDWILL